MKYLNMVRLKNFQSHEDSILEFDNELNVIVGESDTGKSAIIRGIKWVLYNEPSGDFFIKEGKTECSVELEFSDGVRVKRFRSRSKNQYILSYGDEDIIYEGFGVNVPEEIEEAMGINKIELDGNEKHSISLAEQLDGPFLLSERNSIRASAIGRLIGVNVIDDALREALKDNRGVNQERKIAEENIDRINKELKEYEYLDDLKKDIDRLSIIRQDISKKENRLKSLKNLSEKIESMNDDIKYTKIRLDKLKDIEKLENYIIQIESNYKSYSLLKSRYKNLIQIEKDIKINSDLIEQLKGVNNIKSYMDILEDRYKDFIEYKSLDLRYKKNSLEIKKTKDNLSMIKDIDGLDKDLIRLKYLIDRKENIDNIFKSYKDNKNNLNIGYKYTKRFNYTEDIDLISRSLDKKINKLIILKDINKKIVNINNSLDKGSKSMIKIKDQVDIALSKYKDRMSKLDICPICFSKIDDDRLENIHKHYK